MEGLFHRHSTAHLLTLMDMQQSDSYSHVPAPGPRLCAAEPLWQLAPTRGDDGGCLADFMMVIPGLGGRDAACQGLVAEQVREVCAVYAERVVFADINYKINVLWVSLAAEPGLSGEVAAAIRRRVPDALLVGGQIGVAGTLPQQSRSPRGWWQRLRRLSRRVGVLLIGSER